jgi:hypothetical protein
MTVTAHLVFGAVTQQSDVALLCEPRNEPKRELLAVVFDGLAA